MMRKPNFLERVDEDIKHSYVESDPEAIKSLSVLKGTLNVSQEYHYFRPDVCVCATLLSISETYTGLARRKLSHGRNVLSGTVIKIVSFGCFLSYVSFCFFFSLALSLSFFFLSFFSLLIISLL